MTNPFKKATLKAKNMLNVAFISTNRDLNYFRMNYRFEKIVLLLCINFRQRLTYNPRRSWHTLYAMLLSNYKRDDTTGLYP